MDPLIYQRMAELDDSHWWFVARRKILASVIGRKVRFPKHPHILEIGCGTGHNLEMLGQFGTVEATELEPTARGIASKRLGRAVLPAALPDLGMFDPDRFDLVALLDVLEHVEDDVGALAAIHARLRPGGSLLITVPANRWMWSAHDAAHHHHRRYTRSGLKALLKGAGYDITTLSHFNSLLFPPIAAARLAGKLLGREVADDSLPSRPVNGLLKAIFQLEAPLVGRLPLPVGVSLLALVTRPGAGGTAGTHRT